MNLFGERTLNFHSVASNLARHLSPISPGVEAPIQPRPNRQRSQLGSEITRKERNSKISMAGDRVIQRQQKRAMASATDVERPQKRLRRLLDSSSDEEDSSDWDTAAEARKKPQRTSSAFAVRVTQVLDSSSDEEELQETTSGAAQVRAEKDSSRGTWTCSVCTYINRIDDSSDPKYCEMCNSSRSAAPIAEQTKMPSPTPTTIFPTPAARVDSNPNPPSEPKECVVCFEMPVNAALVHGDTAHAFFCFQCASEMKKRKQKCPICRQKIQAVVKVFS